MNTLLSRVAGKSLSLLTISALMLGAFGMSFLQAVPAYAAVTPAAVTTGAATNVTSTDATLNATNGPADASGHSFWVSLTPGIDTLSPTLPAGVFSSADLGAIAAGVPFSASLSSVTGLPAITANTPYYFVAWSNVDGTWYPGAEQTVTIATLSAQDFGVMNVSGVAGYTAGFGLTSADFTGATSVVTQLYSGTTLLQTDTALNLAGFAGFTQFSSPFDVFGTFNYPTDGYWTNAREAEYGQTLIPNKVVATVTLADGQVVTAENGNLTGDPTTIFPTPSTAVTTAAATSIASSDATLNGTNGPADATGHSFWVSTGSFSTASPTLPAGVFSSADLGAIAAGVPFSASLSSVAGILPVAAGTTYYFAAWSNVDGTWYPGAVMSFVTLGTEVPPVPTVSAIAAINGTVSGGDTVTITGTGLTGTTGVNFGTTPATDVVVVNDTSITAVSPAGTGAVDVTVTTPGGVTAVTPADQFTYDLVGVVTGSAGSLAVTSIDSITTNATADGTFAHGWKYVFHITVPTNETNLSMKFANWLDGTNVLAAANDMRISSAQADNSGATVLVAAANTFTSPSLHITGDLDSTTPGDQVEVTVETAVPSTTVNGSYSTSYGVQTLP